jgi:hypothetical protein
MDVSKEPADSIRRCRRKRCKCRERTDRVTSCGLGLRFSHRLLWRTLSLLIKTPCSPLTGQPRFRRNISPLSSGKKLRLARNQTDHVALYLRRHYFPWPPLREPHILSNLTHIHYFSTQSGNSMNCKMLLFSHAKHTCLWASICMSNWTEHDIYTKKLKFWSMNLAFFLDLMLLLKVAQ